MRQLEFRRRGGRLVFPLPQEPPHDERDGAWRAHHDRDRRRPPGLARQITDLIPDYMAMGERGMHEMSEMEMPLPENTAPMMTGQGRSARWAWAACSACSKVRREQKRGDYSTRAGSSIHRARWLAGVGGAPPDPARRGRAATGRRSEGTQAGSPSWFALIAAALPRCCSLTLPAAVLAHGDAGHATARQPGREGAEALGHRRRARRGGASRSA